MKNLVLILLIFVSQIYSQTNSLYTPFEIQNAIKNETRTANGLSGKNYWQNKSEYQINAEVITETGLLIGEETIKYFNNSTDSLNRIVIRLYQDIAKTNASRNWYVNSKHLNNGVDLKELLINDKSIDLSDTSKNVFRGSTNLIVKLDEILPPNSNMTIKIKWQFKIPDEFTIRMGNYGNGNFFVAYWYPQISVYDDIDGWDMKDYQGMVEFYNDFNNYDVKIKVPTGFVAWATGDLQNAKDVLREDIYNKYEKAKSSDETIRIIAQEDYQKGLVTSDNEKNIWNFKAENVTDFSFALSKGFNWDGASVIVDNKNGRRVLTDVVYENGTIHYENAAQYSRESIKYLSHELPGFPYPYSHVTSFCNGNKGGGMETPMMANDGAPEKLANHVGLIFHEIAHNYFPFMMGTNERKYAWMDEGWASFFPREIVDKFVPEHDYLSKEIIGYEKTAGKESELPPMVVSYSYLTESSRTGFYDRPSVAYYELKELLGNDLFKKAMLEYINRWIGKHPIPIDFFNTINDVAKEDLSWFWKPWFYEFGYTDLAIENVENLYGKISAKIVKAGNIPTKVKVVFEFEDGTNETIEKPASVWKNGNKEIIINLESSKKIKKVSVGDKHIPDCVKENDVYVISN
ncbi:MAG: M1 family metallopeptidase [Melioribacteraceae bacterium]